MNTLHHARLARVGETYTMNKLKLAALLILATALSIAACTIGVRARDDGLGLQPDELRERISTDAGKDGVLAQLRAMADDPPGNTYFELEPPRTVEPVSCSPPPCSSADFGVPVGSVVITVDWWTTGHWWPRLCTEKYRASYIFDEQGDYHDLMIEDLICVP